MITEPDSQEQYLEVSLMLPHQVCEVVCDFIIENISSGLVLEDEEDSDSTQVRFYIGTENGDSFVGQLREYLQEVFPEPQINPPEIKSKLITDANWEQQYRQSVTPLWITDEILVRPPWENPPIKPRYDIILEPKMAFGTGRHETTRSCLKLISENLAPSARFLDIGCGSGILSVLAAKMGAEYIKAVDYDPLAIDNCRDNFEINEVSVKNEIVLGSIDACDGDEAYDFVVVNIIKDTIIEMLPRLWELTHPDGKLLLAGLLDRDEREIRTRLGEVGLRSFDVLHDNEWITFLVSGK